MSKFLFNPSLMCMDFLNIKKQLDVLNDKADLLHIDIMDGHYVPNLALSPDFCRAVKSASKLPLDCHLMVTSPMNYIDELLEIGVSYISPHAEVINSYAFRIINKIKSGNCKAGIVLNPATPICYIKHYIHLLDKITVMSVDPGFAGQPFVEESLDKVKELKELREKKSYHYLIEIDGSCNKNTFKKMKESGVDVFIVGSSGLFSLDKDLIMAWKKMQINFNEQ